MCFVHVHVCIVLFVYVCVLREKLGNVLHTLCRTFANNQLQQKCFSSWYSRYWENRFEWKLEIRASYHNRFVQKISVLGLLWQQVRKHKSSTCVYTST